MQRMVAGFIMLHILQIFFIPEILRCEDQPQSSSLAIGNISFDQEIFDTSTGQKVSISFQLSAAAIVSVRIFDFDRDIVATITENQKMAAGNHVVSWNGKDWEGNIVPDEAYFFTIEAAKETQSVIYDPSTSSGGMAHEIERTKILPETQQLQYYLPEKARVSIKAGIVNGPLLAIPVDWEPRDKGRHREQWNGLDGDGIGNVLKQPDYKIRTSYFTLPENAIITIGNKSATYLQYKKNRNHSSSQKPFSSTQQKRSILKSPLYEAGLLYSKALPIEIQFLHAGLDENGVPLINNNTTVQVDFKNDWKTIYSQRKYEIYFFLDNQFIAEDPGVRLPYETPLYLRDFKSGIHTLSVNIISPDRQIGIKNVKLSIN